jgi:CHAD domain-containing protein
MQRSRADADTLHQLRIALKRHRYLLEFIALVTEEEPGEPLDLARSLQDCLGELHDHDLLLERLGGTATERDSPFWHQHWVELPRLVARDRGRLRRKFGRLRARWLALERAAAPAAAAAAEAAVTPEPAAVRPAVHVALVQPGIIPIIH